MELLVAETWIVRKDFAFLAKWNRLLQRSAKVGHLIKLGARADSCRLSGNSLWSKSAPRNRRVDPERSERSCHP